MRLLLDTVTFIWAVHSPERLSKNAVSALQNAEALLELSSISLSEIAIKHMIGKLSFQKDDVFRGIEDLQLHVLSYSSQHASVLFELPLHHSDPFDRQIIAQAKAENTPIVTVDEKFRLYKGVKVIW